MVCRALARDAPNRQRPTKSRRGEISGAVAQLGERLLCKQEVVGSIPSGSTRFCRGATPLQSSACARRAAVYRQAARQRPDRQAGGRRFDPVRLHHLLRFCRRFGRPIRVRAMDGERLSVRDEVAEGRPWRAFIQGFALGPLGLMRAVLVPARCPVPDLEHCEEGRTRLPAAGVRRVSPSGGVR